MPAPSHDIATGKIAVEVDREGFDRFREEVDRWVDDLPGRIKAALNIAPALAAARDEIGDAGFAPEAPEPEKPRARIPEADFGETPTEAKEQGGENLRDEELSEKVSDLDKKVGEIQDILKQLPDLLTAIKTAVEDTP